MARVKSKVNEARKEFRKQVRAIEGKQSGMTGPMQEAQKARKAATARINYQLKKAGLDLTASQAKIPLPKIGKGKSKAELQQLAKSFRALTTEEIQKVIQEEVIAKMSYRDRYTLRLKSLSPYLADQFSNAMEYVKEANNLTDEQVEAELSDCESDVADIEESYYRYMKEDEEGNEHAAMYYLNEMLEQKFGLSR